MVVEERELTCIRCPMGCQLKVQIEGKEVIKVTGNTCKRGEEYGKKECTAPTRTVTSSVVVEGGNAAVVSVKTAEDIPKDKVFDCVKALKNVKVNAPVHIGDIIAHDIAGTGVNIIATSTVECLSK